MELWRLEKYVETLSPEVQRVYRECDSLSMSIADTLTDEFQIVVETLRVFTKYAERYWSLRDGNATNSLPR